MKQLIFFFLILTAKAIAQQDTVITSIFGQDQVVYHPYYQGRQVIEIQLQPDFIDFQMQSMNTYYFPRQNPLIIRDTAGRILAQYNLRYSRNYQPFSDTSFLPPSTTIRKIKYHDKKRTRDENAIGSGIQELQHGYTVFSSTHDGRPSLGILMGLVDTLGILKLDTIYESIASLGDSYVIVYRGKTGIMDRSFQWKIPPELDEMPHPAYINPHQMIVKKNNQYSFIDLSGNYLGKTSYDVIYPYARKKQSYYMVRKNQLYGLLDTSLQVTAPLSYSELQLYFCTENQEYFIARKDGLYGLINRYGKVLLPFAYNHLQGTGNCRLLAGKNRHYGMIDLQGNPIIPLRYDTMIVGKHLRVLLNGQWGFYTAEGKLLAEPRYDELYWSNGYYIAGSKGKYGLVNENHHGVEFITEKYDTMDGLTPDHEKKLYYFLVSRNGQYGVLEAFHNKEVLSLSYAEIKVRPYYGRGPSYFVEREEIYVRKANSDWALFTGTEADLKFTIKKIP